MKRTTLIFALIFAVLFSYLFFVERKQTQHPEAVSEESKRIFGLKPEEIQSVEISRKGKAIEIERSGAIYWTLKKPFADWADRFQSEDLAQSIANLTSQGVVSKSEDAQAYGLGVDAVKVAVKPKTSPVQEIRVGREAPTRQGYYAFLPATGEIILVSLEFGELLKKPADSWRDRSVIHFEPDTVQQIVVQSGKKMLKLNKKGEEWELESPVGARADSNKVIGLLNAVSAARLGRFLPDTKKDFSNAPLFTVSLREKSQAKASTLIVGKKISDGYPAATPDRPFSYVVHDDLVRFLAQDPLSYEDLHLLDFKEADITKLEISIKGADYVFERKGNDWKAAQAFKDKLEDWRAGLIVNDLRGLEKEKIAGAPQKLTKPRVTIKLWGKTGLITTVLVGEKVQMGKELAFPVQVFPSQKPVWGNADLLMKDLP